MDKNRFSEVRKEILVAVYQHVERQRERGIATPIPPSLRGLLKLIGKTSTSYVSYHVNALHVLGYLAPPESKNERATRLTDEGLEKAEELVNAEAKELIGTLASGLAKGE